MERLEETIVLAEQTGVAPRTVNTARLYAPKKKRRAQKEEELYGYFESLRARAAQTAEFETLAAKGDYGGVTKLALAWDATIRQDVLEKAAKELSGKDRDAAFALSKKVLEDLKQMDKLAKAKAPSEQVGGVGGQLKGHVDSFGALMPQVLVERFGASDLGGAVEDL